MKAKNVLIGGGIAIGGGLAGYYGYNLYQKKRSGRVVESAYLTSEAFGHYLAHGYNISEISEISDNPIKDVICTLNQSLLSAVEKKKVIKAFKEEILKLKGDCYENYIYEIDEDLIDQWFRNPDQDFDPESMIYTEVYDAEYTESDVETEQNDSETGAEEETDKEEPHEVPSDPNATVFDAYNEEQRALLKEQLREFIETQILLSDELKGESPEQWLKAVWGKYVMSPARTVTFASVFNEMKASVLAERERLTKPYGETLTEAEKVETFKSCEEYCKRNMPADGLEFSVAYLHRVYDVFMGMPTGVATLYAAYNNVLEHGVPLNYVTQYETKVVEEEEEEKMGDNKKTETGSFDTEIQRLKDKAEHFINSTYKKMSEKDKNKLCDISIKRYVAQAGRNRTITAIVRQVYQDTFKTNKSEKKVTKEPEEKSEGGDLT